MHDGRCAERWQKPDPDSPGQTLAESVMAQFSFRYGVGELWLGVGVTAAWTVVMAGATFLALILLDRETLPPPTKNQVRMWMSVHGQQASTVGCTRSELIRIRGNHGWEFIVLTLGRIGARV